ncbi:MAG: RNA polymerase sigma-70 factor [Bacteroidota bacterium]
MDSQHDERELLLQLLSGSEQAFEKVYNIYSPRLYGNLLKMVKSGPEAQEILQDVFLKVWNNRQNINIEKSFRSYLFKIAENKVYDFFRKAARDKKKQDQLIAIASSGYILFEEQLLTDENAVILEKAIESLPPQRRLVFRLCKLEGKSYREVSELLGISVSTISDHIVKATRTIREYFENNGKVLPGLFVMLFWAVA